MILPSVTMSDSLGMSEEDLRLHVSHPWIAAIGMSVTRIVWADLL